MSLISLWREKRHCEVRYFAEPVNERMRNHSQLFARSQPIINLVYNVTTSPGCPISARLGHDARNLRLLLDNIRIL